MWSSSRFRTPHDKPRPSQTITPARRGWRRARISAARNLYWRCAKTVSVERPALKLRMPELDVVLLNRIVGTCAEPLEQLCDDGGFVLRVSARPGSRLHLDEVSARWRTQQAVEVHVELHAVIGHEPAAPILFNVAFPARIEILTVEASRVRGRSEKAGAEQQHRSERGFARRPRQREPRTRAGDFVLRVEKLVFPVPQASLGGIVEEEI